MPSPKESENSRPYIIVSVNGPSSRPMSIRWMICEECNKKMNPMIGYDQWICGNPRCTQCGKVVKSDA